MSKAGLASIGSKAAFDAADNAVAPLKGALGLSQGMSYVSGDAPNGVTPEGLVAECLRTAENVLNGGSVPGPAAAQQAEIALYVAIQVLKTGEQKGAVSAEAAERLKAQIAEHRDSILILKERPMPGNLDAKPDFEVPANSGNM